MFLKSYEKCDGRVLPFDHHLSCFGGNEYPLVVIERRRNLVDIKVAHVLGPRHTVC